VFYLQVKDDDYVNINFYVFFIDSLTLDSLLGEGAFGVVVRATAFGIQGRDTATTVAVKMLKRKSNMCTEVRVSVYVSV
jgi:Protein tyrosine and serine/threonine kinase